VNRLRRSTLVRELRQLLAGLPRRAWLTIQYHGPREFVFRLVTFPLRLTPIGRRLGLGPRMSDRRSHARSWYRTDWKPVTVVIPTYGDPGLAIAAVESVRRTTDPARVRIVVCDDASAPEHRERLRRELAGRADVVLGDETLGFAGNANRGLRAADGDVALLNSDVICHDDWLEALQWAAYIEPDIGIAGGRLLYEDGTIQHAGALRNPGAPEWFDHRYRFRPADHGPANIPFAALAVTGACMYLKRSLLDAVGLFDEAYGMAYEDVDLCLRAWQAGFWVQYEPAATLTHLESKTRGTEQGERELASQREFWSRWADVFDRREVRGPDGRLRTVYVTEDTGVGGGHRVVFEHLEGLAARGHDVALYTLDGPPDWYPLTVPVRVFEDYHALARQLATEDAIKVATWWNTALPVFRASAVRGVPVFFVQDIETSYYPDHVELQNAVLASYREEFRYLTTSGWNVEQLAGLGHEAAVVAPGIDLETFHPLGLEREPRTVLAVGRSHPLKNFDLTRDAWRSLPEPRPELVLFGVEPKVAPRGARYVRAPSDAEVNELFNRCTVFVQTSRHEGFCLPLLEAMATGAPVVCTDADGNRDFCEDGVNCLMVEDRPEAVAAAIGRLLADPDLRARIGDAGRRTAERYAWEPLIGQLDSFMAGVAGAARAER
jgi:glycosyltransferase involved in cell wall biosynthesis/GT2 family glycosyltransferase